MRRIHQLHLSAPSRPLIGRGQRLLEDAFHTASLPFTESSELVFIRQFNVGTIHPSQSPTGLSRQLEQQFAQLKDIALPGTHPQADQANVVTFPDELTAYAHFAYRLATGQSLQAWFWRKLLPSWHPSQSIHRATHTLLIKLSTHKLCPLSTSIFLKTLSDRTVLTTFLAPLQPKDIHDYFNLYGWPTISPTEQSLPAQTSLRQLIHVAPAGMLPALPAMDWPLSDIRSQWVIALALIAKDPALTSSAEIFQRTHTHIQTYVQLSNLEHTSTDNRHTTKSNAVDFSEAPDLKTPGVVQQPEPERPESPLETHVQFESTPSSFTQYGGLGYLLNALEQLNFPHYLTDYGEPNRFTYRLLHYIARQHCKPENGSVQPAHAPLTDVIFSLHPPAYLQDSAEQNESKTNKQHYPYNAVQLPYCPYRAWHSALRTYLYQCSQLSLFDVIHRPAHLSLTESHLDITFPLNQIDIRLRRAGLDLNPGWLPWFGRVVQFHYQKQLQA